MNFRLKLSRLFALSSFTAGVAAGVLAPSRIASAQPTFPVVHAFAGGTTDGANPYNPLIQASDGNFYGTTGNGGVSGTGTVFTMTPAGTVTILHSFAGGATDGANPFAALIQATDGNFYGTTYRGGTSGNGTVFKTTPVGTVTILHSFTSATDGANPFAPLILATDGNFYGTSSVGGGSGVGTVFTITPAGTFTVLHHFAGYPTDGSYPFAALIQAIDGNFYGTTSNSVGSGGGTVFKMTPAGTVTILHYFAGGTTDGAAPYAALIQATSGNFYGTTSNGGASGQGTVFTITPAGTVTILHSFSGGTTDGLNPYAALIQATDGNFYGTTYGGGASTAGTVFKMTPAGTVTVLHWFAGGTTDGANPYAALIQATDGNFYGTTYGGGASSVGVVFRLANKPGLVDFDGDGKTDIVVYRPSSGTWFILNSSTNYTTSNSYQWGISTDVPTPGDYDGDGKTDAAVYRPSNGTWYILQSSSNYTTFVVVPWGSSTDIPMPGDYDGDGKTDLAVYRPSTATWFVLYSSTNYTTWISYQWGAANDIPISGDYDGDGKTDLAVYRPSTATWYIRYSSTNYATWNSYQWGAANGDVPQPGDYDGDGKTDLAVYRPSTATWYIRYSSTNYTTSNSYQWGAASSDVPVPGDYDGDGKTDLAVYRPSTATWYIRYSSTNYTTSNSYQWGAASSDVPVRGRP